MCSFLLDSISNMQIQYGICAREDILKTLKSFLLHWFYLVKKLVCKE